MSFKANEPFILAPAGKDYLWGGSRLADDFAKNIDMSPLAETWECSTHPEGESIAASGAFCGQKLSEIVYSHPEYLGTHASELVANLDRGQIPILVKLIDAKQDLSVQVHPGDEYARANENGSLGKTEMWYVLDAGKDAHLLYGFNRDITKAELENSLKDGSATKYMNLVPISEGDVFFVPAGQVHAICQGALVAEVQENSDITYRLYDYDRVDKDSNKRPLHVEKALEVADLSSSAIPRQPMVVRNFHKGYATQLLCRCKYFETYRFLLDTQHRVLAKYATGSSSFEILLCTSGCGTVSYGDTQFNFYKGDCIFVPADSVEMELHGRAELLQVRC